MVGNPPPTRSGKPIDQTTFGVVAIVIPDSQPVLAVKEQRRAVNRRRGFGYLSPQEELLPELVMQRPAGIQTNSIPVAIGERLFAAWLIGLNRNQEKPVRYDKRQ